MVRKIPDRYVVVTKPVLKALGKEALIDMACGEKNTHKTRNKALKLAREVGNATTVKLPQRCLR